jgi:hypothetical protein
MTTFYKTGRLVLDRYDFDKHLDGSDFKHNANNINLVNSIEDTTTHVHYTNVEDAIHYIYSNANIQLPSATATLAGIVKLKGDLKDNQSNPSIFLRDNITVVGLQKTPISSTLPNNNQVLRYISGSGSGSGKWEPSDITFSLTFDGDVSAVRTGSNYTISVKELTGSGVDNNVIAKSAALTINNQGSFYINWVKTTASSANTLNLLGQESTVGSGGDIILTSGQGNTATNHGKIKLSLNNLYSFGLSTTLAGNNYTYLTGDFSPGDYSLDAKGAVLIKDVGNSSVITGNINGGVALYSYNGKLNLFYNDKNVILGELDENVIEWGSTVKVNTYKYSINQLANLAPFSFLSKNSFKLDIIVVAKDITNNNYYSENISYFGNNISGTLSQISDNRYNYSSSWGSSLFTPVDISISGTNVIVKSGKMTNTSITENWLFVIQVVYY